MKEQLVGLRAILIPEAFGDESIYRRGADGLTRLGIHTDLQTVPWKSSLDGVRAPFDVAVNEARVGHRLVAIGLRNSANLVGLAALEGGVDGAVLISPCDSEVPPDEATFILPSYRSVYEAFLGKWATATGERRRLVVLTPEETSAFPEAEHVVFTYQNPGGTRTKYDFLSHLFGTKEGVDTVADCVKMF